MIQSSRFAGDVADWGLVIGAGPSLKRSDLDLLRGNVHSVAVNCAVFLAPWADELFAADNNWWDVYGPKVQWYKGHRTSRNGSRIAHKSWRGKGWARTGGNSGHMAIQYISETHSQVAIIGFDQQVANGRAHYHKDHQRRTEVGTRSVFLGNAEGARHWPNVMNKTSGDLKNRGVRVLNLSRETALTCFERMSVETFLTFIKEN